ncbi:MAG TPA: GNAT family N-acetyltransferase, partial [Ilumatobacteraceae bacterium]|nr:GNAT family N-acetyltransferase [Ilumatobacteraceae bacterium]
MSDYDIRPVAVDERRAASDTLRVALLSGAINDEHFAAFQASWDESDAFAAWDGDQCVGHVAAFRFDSTVPGGARVPTAGVTRVGVLPTHTRRGLLTQLMHRLLRDAHEQNNVLSALHASETSIYRRFGFGLATDSACAVITTRHTKPWRSMPLPGSMRLLPYGQVLAVVPDLYERVARWHVGSISRPGWMWPRILKNASQPTVEPYGKGSFVAVHSDPSGADDGFVFYEVDWDETFAKNPTGVGKVHDLWGASPAVELELWRYLLDIDLITTWKAEPRPIDEPVRRAMHDSRAYEAVQRFDDQWIRNLDVDAALTARAYGTDQDSVNVRVHDPMFATNTGTWTISATGADRNDGPADIEVDIGTLSA